MVGRCEELLERIRLRAYYLWLENSSPAHLDEEFWFRAEMRELARFRLEALISTLSEGAAYSHVFNSDVAPSPTWKGMIGSKLTDEDSGFDYVRLAKGHAKANSGGVTNGYSIRLPDAVELAASGRQVCVKVVARAAEAGGSRFAIAYSTNEVGNSGWRWRDATPEWSSFGMEFDVPVMKNGNGDFVGILPDVEGKPGVDICFVSVHVS